MNFEGLRLAEVLKTVVLRPRRPWSSEQMFVRIYHRRDLVLPTGHNFVDVFSSATDAVEPVYAALSLRGLVGYMPPGVV